MATELVLPRFEMRPLSQEEGGGYLIEFPDYPGCVADGQWLQRVPKSLHAALARRAEHEGVSLNMLVTTLLAEGIERRSTERDRASA